MAAKIAEHKIDDLDKEKVIGERATTCLNIFWTKGR